MQLRQFLGLEDEGALNSLGHEVDHLAVVLGPLDLVNHNSHLFLQVLSVLLDLISFFKETVEELQSMVSVKSIKFSSRL